MKKLKQLFLKKCNAILVALLGVFGFSGCDRYGPMEYGTPHTNFIIKGTVVSQAGNKPVEGIQVKFIDRLFIDMDGNERIRYVITNTNEDGFFKFQSGDVFLPENPKLRFTDENGVFVEKDKEFDWDDAVRTRPARGWFSGEFTKTLETVQLTKRADEDYDDEDGDETNE